MTAAVGLEPILADAAAPAEVAESRLYRDAASLAFSSLIAAAMGLGFWAVAARTLAPEKLGVQTALLSAMIGPALIIAPGVGDALNAIVPGAGSAKASVIRHGYRLVLIFALPCGVISGAVSMTALHDVRGSFAVGFTVAGGTVLWSFFTVQDSALTSLGKARWLPLENGLVGAVKLGLLPLLAALSLSLVWSTLLPAAAAVAILLPIVARLTRHRGQRLARAQTREINSLAIRTTSSVALTLGAFTLLPFAVTAFGGPAEGAAFSLSISLVSVLDFVTSGVGVSLVVQSASRGCIDTAMVFSALRRTALVVGAGAIVITAAAHAALRILNPAYLGLHGVLVIAILAATSLLRTVYLIWAAAQQARRELGPVLRLNVVAAVGLYAGIALTCPRYGAVAAALVLAGAQAVLSIGALVHLLASRGSGRNAQESS